MAMNIGNWSTARILQSPFHGILSRSHDLVRYTGRRSGKTFTTPTQYAPCEDGIVIFVARPERKTWWRNFLDGHDLQVLLHGRWAHMRGRAIVGHEQPEVIRPLLAAYLSRYPHLERHLPEGATEPEAAVVVWCQPLRAEIGKRDPD